MMVVPLCAFIVYSCFVLVLAKSEINSKHLRAASSYITLPSMMGLR